MAALTPTIVGGPSVVTNVLNTLTASDTFTYFPGDILHLRNATAGALTPTLIGSTAPAAFGVLGVGNLNLTTGVPGIASIPAAGERTIVLDVVSNYLAGVVTIAAGTGIIATILRRA